MGPGEKKKDIRGSLRYNDYIVYDIDQVKMQYLVKCKFNSAC